MYNLEKIMERINTEDYPFIHLSSGEILLSAISDQKHVEMIEEALMLLVINDSSLSKVIDIGNSISPTAFMQILTWNEDQAVMSKYEALRVADDTNNIKEAYERKTSDGDFRRTILVRNLNNIHEMVVNALESTRHRKTPINTIGEKQWLPDTFKDMDEVVAKAYNAYIKLVENSELKDTNQEIREQIADMVIDKNPEFKSKKEKKPYIDKNLKAHILNLLANIPVGTAFLYEPVSQNGDNLIVYRDYIKKENGYIMIKETVKNTEGIRMDINTGGLYITESEFVDLLNNIKIV